MAERILQLLPYPPEVRIAWYREGKLELHRPTCMVLIEKGALQEVAYMETVDNVVERVDTENKSFLGFVEEDDQDALRALRELAREKYIKEQSVK